MLSLITLLTLGKLTGIATTSCSGCHGGGAPEPTVTLTGPQTSVAPGSTVTLTLTIGGGVSNGGFFLTTGGVGTFSAGNGTRVLGNGLSHSTPRAASGGSVTFTVQWTAPATPGGVEFDVGVIGGNADGRSSGDRSGFKRLSLAWGCTPTAYYTDGDRDGHGNPFDTARLRCAPSAGLSTRNDDCEDNDERISPSAVEACNGRDDNCNGQIDEGLTSTLTWPDLDGDGFGDPTGATQMGCTTMKRAANDRDCDDGDAKVFPDAPEVCNLKDDDCDSRVDDGVRVRCGIGWCARFGPTCDPMYCMPGEPVTETCNALDDDCDGLTDEGQLCGDGVCFEGECYSADAPPPIDGGGGGAGGGAEPPSSGCSTAPFPSLLGLALVVLLTARRAASPRR